MRQFLLRLVYRVQNEVFREDKRARQRGDKMLVEKRGLCRLLGAENAVDGYGFFEGIERERNPFVDGMSRKQTRR